MEYIAVRSGFIAGMSCSHFDESQKRFHAECSTRDEKVSQPINPLKSSLEEMNRETLRHPVERGKWGEAQLKRFVEMSTSFDGSLRAEMVVTLPNSRKIIIDAKVPLEAYLKAIEAESPEICEKGDGSGAIDFTVLFLPSEAILAAALRKKSHLIELAIEKHILLASPSTLMALLKIALQSVGPYNTAIQSFESRFLVTMRKLTKESEIASNSVVDGFEPLSTPCAELSMSQEGL
ncbi:hypothetical protein ACTFIY_009606 [Dictyostelium cf. discoideum]